MFVDLILTDLKKYADANQATIFKKILKGDATFVVQLKNGKGPCWKYTVMNEDDQVVGWALVFGECVEALEPLFRAIRVREKRNCFEDEAIHILSTEWKGDVAEHCMKVCGEYPKSGIRCGRTGTESKGDESHQLASVIELYDLLEQRRQAGIDILVEELRIFEQFDFVGGEFEKSGIEFFLEGLEKSGIHFKSLLAQEQTEIDKEVQKEDQESNQQALVSATGMDADIEEDRSEAVPVFPPFAEILEDQIESDARAFAAGPPLERDADASAAAARVPFPMVESRGAIVSDA
uniref:Uncharacterized protein n=1 Tax=Chromera velia CCMP2878 TaxID=1169474 RepID=A0A0G4FYX8_9ALVE|eukprot:Cvel_3944.t1-p1 / transcript=Cvel_3944.t1 / gene=Cvel_3944 / organism=Chromera_velia_CCMP2878 / gene_product=hypothetical protein / transcript_product=hypothetical protein / location=Cvel_scaffold167:83356-85626(-) / protein_length=291 / sequence_SO=supercontig / SO=protein_coding / is_pseudo=false